jgi:hypothetical protein
VAVGGRPGSAVVEEEWGVVSVADHGSSWVPERRSVRWGVVRGVVPLAGVAALTAHGWCRVETMPFRGLPWYCPWALFFAGTDTPATARERKESTVRQVTASDGVSRVSDRLLSTVFALASVVPAAALWRIGTFLASSAPGPPAPDPRRPGPRRPAPDARRGVAVASADPGPARPPARGGGLGTLFAAGGSARST